MDNQQEIEQLAQAIYDSKIALDGSDYLFGIDGDDHFTKLAMHLVYGGYGNIVQAVTDYTQKLKDKLQDHYDDYWNGTTDICKDGLDEDDIDETLKEFKNERTD